jgi:hypothetical protein
MDVMLVIKLNGRYPSNPSTEKVELKQSLCNPGQALSFPDIKTSGT